MICDKCKSEVYTVRRVEKEWWCPNCRLQGRPRCKGFSAHIFKPRIMEHLTSEPGGVLIESKRQLIDVCHKQGVRTPLVWDQTDHDHGDQFYKEDAK